MANKAAWLDEAKGSFQVRDAPMPTPGPNEVVIRNHAVAINPLEWAQQYLGIVVNTYPHILGCDVAGEIVDVGSAVTAFAKGDRVMALMNGSCHAEPIATQKSTNAAFQLYSATTAILTAKLPDSVSYTQGAVLPLGLSTAAGALFEKGNHELPLPKINPESTGKVLVVWGGSSSVGSCGIQLAKAAGYQVAAIASARNHDYCKSLGADYVFDYAKDDVLDQVAAELKGLSSAGVFSAIMDPATLSKAGQLVTKLGGDQILSSVLAFGMPWPDDMPEGVRLSQGGEMLRNTAAMNV